MKITDTLEYGDFAIDILSDKEALESLESHMMKEIGKEVHAHLNGFLGIYKQYGQRKDEPIRYRVTLELGHISEFKEIEEDEMLIES